MPSPRKVSPSPSLSACTSFLNERSIASTCARGRFYIGAGANATRPRPPGTPGAALFDRDVRLANDAAVLLALPPQIGAEFRAADPNRKQSLLSELGLHVGSLERAAEPTGQLSERVRRRLRRRDDAIEDVRLVVADASLAEGGHVRQRLDPCARGGDEPAQR